MAISSEHRSKFATLHWQRWCLHMSEIFSSGRQNPKQTNKHVLLNKLLLSYCQIHIKESFLAVIYYCVVDWLGFYAVSAIFQPCTCIFPCLHTLLIFPYIVISDCENPEPLHPSGRVWGESSNQLYPKNSGAVKIGEAWRRQHSPYRRQVLVPSNLPI